MIEEEKTRSQIAILNQEFLTSWELCTRPFQGAELSDRPGIATRWANIAFRFYNAICLIAEIYDEEALAHTVREGIDFMRARTCPGWMVVPLESLTDKAQSALPGPVETLQLASMPATGMAGEILPLEEKVNRNLSFERIRDDDTVGAFAELNCLAYGFPAESCVIALFSSFWWQPGRTHSARVMQMPSSGALSIRRTRPPASDALRCRQMPAVRFIDAWATSMFAGLLAFGRYPETRGRQPA